MPQKIEQTILDFPKQIKNGLRKEKQIFPFSQKFDNVLVCGMGSSALAAEFLKKLYPIRIHRNYNLPQKPLTTKTLVICLSYSGNTEETISAYKIAQKSKLPLIAISTNGLLKKKALHDRIPFVPIKTRGIEPRLCVGEEITLLVSLFKKIKIASFKRFDDRLPKLNPQLFKKTGEKIASNILDKIPLIYASSANQAIAYYWKAVLNENAKIAAFWNVFPEINHNELMQGRGIKQKNDFYILNLRDNEDLPTIQKRMEITARLLRKKGFKIETIEIKGSGALEKMFNAIILGNWVSLCLAQKLNIDPLDPDIREDFKQLMALNEKVETKNNGKLT